LLLFNLPKSSFFASLSTWDENTLRSWCIFLIWVLLLAFERGSWVGYEVSPYFPSS
jgi:hypothetical protein